MAHKNHQQILTAPMPSATQRPHPHHQGIGLQNDLSFSENNLLDPPPAAHLRPAHTPHDCQIFVERELRFLRRSMKCRPYLIPPPRIRETLVDTPISLATPIRPWKRTESMFVALHPARRARVAAAEAEKVKEREADSAVVFIDDGKDREITVKVEEKSESDD